MEKKVMQASETLRDFLFKKVYNDLAAKEEESRAHRMLSAMYEYFKNNTQKLPDFYKKLLENYDIDTVISDYISSMTDRYAVFTFEEIFVPKNFFMR